MHSTHVKCAIQNRINCERIRTLIVRGGIFDSGESMNSVDQHVFRPTVVTFVNIVRVVCVRSYLPTDSMRTTQIVGTPTPQPPNQPVKDFVIISITRTQTQFAICTVFAICSPLTLGRRRGRGRRRLSISIVSLAFTYQTHTA